MLVLGAACGPTGAGGDEPARLRATVVPSGGDTVRFAAPAVARRCDDGRSLLIESAAAPGNGVLILLRYGDTLASGSFPLLTFGDSTTPRGARVAVRYMIRDAARGFALDSGTVELRDPRGGPEVLHARVRGTGIEGATRTLLDAEVIGAAFEPDTASCRAGP